MQATKYFGWLWLVALCGLGTIVLMWPSGDGSSRLGSELEQSQVSMHSTYVGRAPSDHQPVAVTHQTIEKIRVGQRVMAWNPQVSDETRSSWQEPNWDEWVKLKLEMPKPDGSILKMELLRPADWLDQQGAVWVEVRDICAKDLGFENVVYRTILLDEYPGEEKASQDLEGHICSRSQPNPLRWDSLFSGARTPLFVPELNSTMVSEYLGTTVQMDLPELGLTGDAHVIEVAPIPDVLPGNGKVVTATFHHTSGKVIDLGIGAMDQSEASETIGTTSNHPFWSVDRQEYVQAGSLEVGERLQTWQGDTKRVVSKLARPGPEPVFNLEVHAEHVYFVGQDGILVHNNYRRSARFNPNSERWHDPVTGNFVRSPGAANDVLVDTGVLRNFVADGSKVRFQQYSAIKGQRMLATQETLAEFRRAMARTGSATERVRADYLVRKLTLVADDPSSLFSSVSASRKLGSADLGIFGTADKLGVRILTTDATFVRTFQNRTGHTVNATVFRPY